MLQVLEAYAKYADGLLEASRQRQDGRRGPSVRLLFKPLMGMFYNMPRGKKWRNAVRLGALLLEIDDRQLC